MTDRRHPEGAIVVDFAAQGEGAIAIEHQRTTDAGERASLAATKESLAAPWRTRLQSGDVHA